MSAMPACLLTMFAAEVLPPEFPQPGGQAPGPGNFAGGQAAPILLAALLVVAPLVLLLAFSRRRQRRRKLHLPRNPTLAETGGLPPPRQS
ncbi:MAG: hypothetical protein ABMA26_13195 [Limisphaerales bacterium]